MTCKESKERILRFDQLSENEQDQFLEHIEMCSTCQTYFDQYLTLEEGLDFLLQEEDIHVTSIKKRAVQRIFKQALLTCASLFLIIVGAWNTPPVKAAIEKALNEVIIDHLLKGQQPLDDNDKNATTEKIIYAEQSLDGRTVFVYLSGQKVRNEYENGNYSISDGKYLATYSKKDNLFFIQKLDYESVPFEVEFYQDIDPNSIKYIGEKEYLDRQAEVYLIEESQDLQREYWFDKDTSIFIKEVEIFKGNRQNKDNLQKFKIIEVKKNHRLFDFIAPDGARIIDETNQ